MVRPIVKDPIFLARRSAEATAEDLPAAQDLLDTLTAHREECVGMAGNMIGTARRIIVFACDDGYALMFNPVIVKKSGPYEAEEGCLSLTGVRKVRRWKNIKVQYQDAQFRMRLKSFSGWTAEIIQHEIDHCDGILI